MEVDDNFQQWIKQWFTNILIKGILLLYRGEECHVATWGKAWGSGMIIISSFYKNYNHHRPRQRHRHCHSHRGGHWHHYHCHSKIVQMGGSGSNVLQLGLGANLQLVKVQKKWEKKSKLAWIGFSDAAWLWSENLVSVLVYADVSLGQKLYLLA